MRRDSYQITQSGRHRFRDWIKSKSFAIVRILTTDAEFSLAYLLRNDEDDTVRIGYCVDGSRQQWETANVRRSRIVELVRLSPQGRLAA